MVGGGGARGKARGGTARCSLTFMYCTPSGRKMVFSFHVFSGQGMGCRQRYEERMLAPLARGGSPLHRPKLMDGVCSPPSVAVEAAPSYFANTLVTLACAATVSTALADGAPQSEARRLVDGPVSGRAFLLKLHLFGRNVKDASLLGDFDIRVRPVVAQRPAARINAASLVRR